MDPTMQSPTRRTIPFSGGAQITLPDGPHFYRTENWVGSLSQGNSLRQAFEALKRHAIPFQGAEESVDGQIMRVPGLGPIHQRVDPDRLSIVNSTMPEHLLHPGNVFRTIVTRGDDIYVVTEGYGTGMFPRANEAARVIWDEPDHFIRRDLNPYGGIGYPLDEMNAVAKTGASSATARPSTPLPQPQERPERHIPPPIFFSPY